MIQGTKCFSPKRLTLSEGVADIYYILQYIGVIYIHTTVYSIVYSIVHFSPSLMFLTVLLLPGFFFPLCVFMNSFIIYKPFMRSM